MGMATLVPLAADDFLRLHGDEYGIELIDGEIRRFPMPGLEHGEICGNIYYHLREVVKRNRLGRVMTNDPFVRTRTNPDGCRGADVLYVSYDTYAADLPTPKGAISPPLELVVEVRSPRDSDIDLANKTNEYLAAGVRVVMVVDPETRSAGVFRSGELPQRFANGDVVTLPDILPGFAVPIAEFFA